MIGGTIHMFATVVGVMLTSLFVDKKLPYFPIEVSRMAASGPVALLTFRIGCTTLFLTTWAIDGFPSYNIILLCVSLAVIAIFDDVRSLLGHMLGILGLAVCASIQVWSKPLLVWTCLVPAAAIYLLRVILKAYFIHFWERRQPFRLLFNVHVQEENVLYGVDLMFGKRKFVYAETEMIFELGGFLQWVVFVILGVLFYF